VLMVFLQELGMQVAAQSPGHITGFFVIYPNGSTGAGLNIKDGMKTTVRFHRGKKDELRMNGKKTKLIVSEKVLGIFRKKTRTPAAQKVKVLHTTKFPIGYGLGISGAGALSLCIALNRLFKAGLDKKEILAIAKQAEIECGTGLGDVVAEQFSGVMIGKKPYPSKGIEKIRAKEKFVALGFFNPMSTKKIIRSPSWKRKINKTGLACMAAINMEKTMPRFVGLCRKFTGESGLATPQIKKVMAKVPGASMSMLGETVFMPDTNPKNALKALGKYCKRAMVARIATKGAGLL
ncbi:MAG: hypothetical protein Q8Q97_00600, partial [bacterium]|nr:hypothetical protein [bacterium]